MTRVTATNRVLASGRTLAANRLVIPVQQNLLAYSEAADEWLSDAITIEEVGGSSPLSTTIFEITETTDNNYHTIYQGFPAGGIFENSEILQPIYYYAALKKSASAYASLDLLLALGNTFITVDLEEGTVIDVDTTEGAAVVQDLAGGLIEQEDGWFLVWLTCKVTTSYHLSEQSVYVMTSNGAEGVAGLSYAGNGSRSILFGGANFALTNHRTPYRLTEGTVYNDGMGRVLIS